MVERRMPLPRRAILQRGAVLLSAAALGAGGCHRTPVVPTRVIAGGRRREELDTQDGVVPIDADDPQQGPATAVCVLVVFSDFQCPFCREAALILERLRKEFPDKTRLVFKHLPIPAHKDAQLAAVAAQVVWLEGGSEAFWRYHDLCFDHPHELSSKNLLAWAAEVGVQPASIEKRAPEAQLRVEEDLALASRLEIGGTPRQYVNRRRVQGAYPYEQMRAWVDEEV